MNRQRAPKPLTKKEKQFCLHFASTGNPREAAARAGYSLFPERTGNALLERPEISAEIGRIQTHREEKGRLKRVRTGYERLAFGSIADAVRLLYSDGFSPSVLEELDLYNISEIKRPREGAMEIKFFDRLEALDRLRECERLLEDEESPFYRALEKGAQALEGTSRRTEGEVS